MNEEAPNASDWDRYWATQSVKDKTYNIIANFYRRYLIRRSLNSAIKGIATSSDRILHAGCGAGEVDVELHEAFSIISVDFSIGALLQYQDGHGPNAAIAQADILILPFRSNSFNIIFNLGVMEHFTDAQISNCLAEFNRVLELDGKLCLFWPPRWGLSVMILHSLTWLFRKIFRIELDLYPAEINLYSSRRRLKNTLAANGFMLNSSKFGWSDLFTHQIITAHLATKCL